ncbi:hypothetical protein Lal_00018253 [Lupinus albus]|uniref:Putative ubiquitinyl hydrolase 1 n=1 Tax=Lupinus albus TaxID=3870 RepID=A0A6A4N0L1_LUPAL|nr:putative ubiquitinyl hydrolase 1 [Lupinus albus]KAF1866867.1 hypothetical protein Lal_00018253 [Lupinus albus]
MENQKETKINLEKFTWMIESFSKNTKKLQSKSFEIGGCRWRIIMNPIGKGVDQLSFCLKVSGSIPTYRWRKFAYFKLALVNQMDREKSIVRETQQKFNTGYRIWGSSFINLSDFYNPKEGYLINDKCIIEAHVTVSDNEFKITIPSLTHSVSIAAQTECSEETMSSTTQTELELQSQEDFGIVIPPLEETPSPKNLHFDIIIPSLEDTQSPKQPYYNPTAPPFYPPIYDDEPKVEPLIHLSEVLDINSLGPEEAAFFPLLEEVCLKHPSLIESLMRKSPKYILWSFIALGQVLYFLKTMKVKNMKEEACKHLQCLWEEVQLFGFNLSWLEPYIEAALNVKAYLEKAEKVKILKESVVDFEIELRKLRTKLDVAEVDLEIAMRDLEEVENGFEERDINAELGYGT